MANVRCPMCGKNNTPEAEVCAFCGARLKPVRPASQSETGGAVPDWLDDLRFGDNEPGPKDDNANFSSALGQEKPVESGPADMPDWLTRIRERARGDQSGDVFSEGVEKLEPDWMQELRDETPASPGVVQEGHEEESTGTSESLENWLDRLPGGTAESAGASEPPVGQADEEIKIDDWLQSYPEQSTVPAGNENEDWIQQLAEWQSNQGETLDKSSQEINGAIFEQPENEPAQTSFGATDFLAGLQAEQPKDTSPVEPMRDLSAAEASPIQSGAVEDEIPDWLREGDQAQPVRSTSVDESALPDWLKTDDLSASTPPQPGAEGSMQGTDLPGWFGHFEEQPDTASEPAIELKGALPDHPEANLPDWLREKEQPIASAGQAPEELPLETDWAAPFEAESADNLPEEVDISMTASEMSQSVAMESGFDETPDWLSEFSAQAQNEEDVTLSDIHLNEEPVAADDMAFADNELPDWLAETDQTEEPSLEAGQVDVRSEEIARADLPEWIKEMRPIEAVIPGDHIHAETGQQVEKAGPLAGLRGVLPAEEPAGYYRKPPVYSAKLRISEKQRSQASLFESILTQETQPLLIAPERSRAPRILARVLVSLLFFAVLVGARMFSSGSEPALMLTPPELRDMFNQIDQNAQTQAPVLVAVDFEPGRAGEMKLVASPVIEHLMVKNYKIVLLSTAPAGPAMAQSLLSSAAGVLETQANQTYDLSANTLNLGYLPGGTISLLEFAQIPSRAAPATLEGDYTVWQDSFLNEVKGLNDFSQVIVLTDSAETGRAWVEQVQPLMGDTPLLMATSAQAEPLLIPFVQSNQIDGMVSGLLGGVIYGQWRQVNTSAAGYWGMYQTGILLGLGMMLVGGLFSSVAAIVKRKEKDGV